MLDDRIHMLMTLLTDVGFAPIESEVAEEVFRSDDGRTEVRFNDLEDNEVVIIRYHSTPWSTPPEHLAPRRMWEIHATSTTPVPILFGLAQWPDS